MPAVGTRRAMGLIPQSSASPAEWTIGGVQLSFFPPQRYIGCWVDLHGEIRPSVSEIDLWQAAEKGGRGALLAPQE
ncbi:MAG: hypothetical protein Q8P04_00110 [bacterium]|nr:hypothetical protein [bacterium]